jgi:hypothetical protein
LKAAADWRGGFLSVSARYAACLCAKRPEAPTHMPQKTPPAVASSRQLFKALPAIDLAFFCGLGVLGVIAVVTFALR